MKHCLIFSRVGLIYYITIVLCSNILWLKAVNEINARQTRTSFAKFSKNYSIEYLTTEVELVLQTFRSWDVHKIVQYLTLGLLFSLCNIYHSTTAYFFDLPCILWYTTTHNHADLDSLLFFLGGGLLYQSPFTDYGVMSHTKADPPMYTCVPNLVRIGLFCCRRNAKNPRFTDFSVSIPWWRNLAAVRQRWTWVHNYKLSLSKNVKKYPNFQRLLGEVVLQNFIVQQRDGQMHADKQINLTFLPSDAMHPRY